MSNDMETEEPESFQLNEFWFIFYTKFKYDIIIYIYICQN